MKATRLGDRIFSRPAFLNEPPQKSRNWFVNLLIALLVFVIATEVQSIILGPIQAAYLLRSLDLSRINALLNGGAFDVEGLFEMIGEWINSMPAWVTLLSLFLFITITLAVYVCRVKIQKGTLLSLGFTRKGALPQYLIGYAAGLGAFGLSVLLCVLTGGLRFDAQALPSFTDGMWIVLFFLGYLVQGMAEEVLCRGFLMTALTRRNSRLTAVLVNSAFFAVLHLANPGLTPLAFVNLFLFGVLASLLVLKTGSIWPAAALHSAWNFAQGNLFGISVSGMSRKYSLLNVSMTDAALWNGGAFGMEGGLCVTFVMLAGVALLVLWNPKRDPALPAAAEGTAQ